MIKTPLKILLVEDDPDDILLISDAIKRGIRDWVGCIDSASSYSQALSQLQDKCYDILFFDYRLGKVTGLELLKTVQEKGITTPVIFLTGKGDENVAVEVMKAGASDYLTKGNLSPELLSSSIRYTIEIHKREKKRKVAEAKLQSSEEKYRTLFNRMAEGFALCRFSTSPEEDTQYFFAEVNLAFETITGHLKETVIGRGLFELFPEAEDGLSGFTTTDKKSESIKFECFCKKFNKYFNFIIFFPHKEQLALILMDITERKLDEKKIRYLSFHDKLTGVSNRAYLEEKMGRMNLENQMPLTFVMADINGLKLVNDVFGYHRGDELLKKAAQVLKNVCSNGEEVARWGGDEFVILLPKTDQAKAAEFVKKVKTACTVVDHKPIQLSISLGTYTKENVFERVTDPLKEAEDRMFKNKLLQTESIRNAIISSFLKTLGEKDYETEAHVMRMQKFATQFGIALGLADNQLDELVLAVSLHDIGKVGIPETILNKKDSLSDEEWKIMKKHSEIGCRLAQSSPEIAHIAKDILYHHEHWDGSGYPKGIKENKIPLTSRIVSIVDAYDVMTHHRPYKKAIYHQQAVNELIRYAGKQFDPYLVKVFIETFTKEHKDSM